MALVDERRKIWVTAEVLSRGTEKTDTPLGVYELYETLVMQYDNDELSHEQMKIMGLAKVDLINAKKGVF